MRALLVLVVASCCPEVDGAKVSFAGSAGDAAIAMSGEDSSEQARAWTLESGGSQPGMLHECVNDLDATTAPGLSFDMPMPYVLDVPVAIKARMNDCTFAGFESFPGDAAAAVWFQSSTWNAEGQTATGTITARSSEPLSLDVDVTFTNAGETLHVTGTTTFKAARVTQPCL